MLLGRSKLAPSVNSLPECFSATSWQSGTGVRISHLSKNHSWSVFLQQTGTKSFENGIARKSTSPRVPHPQLEKPISGQIFSQAPHWFPDTNNENQSGRENGSARQWVVPRGVVAVETSNNGRLKRYFELPHRSLNWPKTPLSHS